MILDLHLSIYAVLCGLKVSNLNFKQLSCWWLISSYMHFWTLYYLCCKSSESRFNLISGQIPSKTIVLCNYPIISKIIDYCTSISLLCTIMNNICKFALIWQIRTGIGILIIASVWYNIWWWVVLSSPPICPLSKCCVLSCMLEHCIHPLQILFLIRANWCIHTVLVTNINLKFYTHYRL